MPDKTPDPKPFTSPASQPFAGVAAQDAKSKADAAKTTHPVQHPSNAQTSPGKDAIAPNTASQPVGGGEEHKEPGAFSLPSDSSLPQPKVASDSTSTSDRKKDEAAAVPRVLRAIAPDGNVLKAESWSLKRDPSEDEKEAFLHGVRGASRIDIAEKK